MYLPPQIRDDLSDNLIHLTKGISAKEIFFKIVSERKLKGSNRGNPREASVICFSEAPISKLGLILAYGKQRPIRYEPYGFMFNKKHLFNKGARPAIYQPYSELADLSEKQKYRHVTYDLNKNIDFTWEREWRLQTEELELHPEQVTLIVPNKEVERQMFDKHSNTQTGMALALEGLIPIQSFPWHIACLADLGFNMDEYLS